MAVQIWRSTALAQLLYGCELRLMYAKMLQGFAARQRLDVARRPPLQLCIYRMAELLGTPALGACSLREPAEEMGLRRLRWLAVVANDTGIVGTLHRLLATRHTADWVEPSTALQTALNDVGWRVVRNRAALCSTDWPRLLPEPSYAGEVRLQPVADPPPPGAAWTDGSLGGSGGAAAVQMDSGRQLQCGLRAARSSTQCELVALQLVRRLEPSPPLVLTDSLCALQLIQGWGQRSTARVLESEDRAEVRGFLHQWRDHPTPPVLEKVAAHNREAIQAGDAKAVGNDRADFLAKQAAQQATEEWVTEDRFEDAVRLRDGDGAWIGVVDSAFQKSWWRKQRRAANRRPWPARVYPPHLEIEWAVSQFLFRAPSADRGCFVHRLPDSVLKWVARARTGALATRARMHETKLVASAQCLCCGAAQEDEDHMLLECVATGAAEWRAQMAAAWTTALREAGLPGFPLSADWIEDHRVQLVVALIPLSVRRFFTPPDAPAVTVALRTFHKILAERLAETCRQRVTLTKAAERRQRPPSEEEDELRNAQPPPRVRLADLLGDEVGAGTPMAVAPVPPRRRFSKPQMAAITQARRDAAADVHRWLQRRLQDGSLHRVGDDVLGAPTVALLLWWEADVQRAFPGHSAFDSRKEAFTRALRAAVEVDPDLCWMKSQRVGRPLGPGLPRTQEQRWNIRVTDLETEPYRGAWRAYVVSVLRDEAAERAEGTDLNTRRRKRQRLRREHSPPPSPATPHMAETPPLEQQVAVSSTSAPPPPPVVPDPPALASPPAHRGCKRPSAGPLPRRPPPASRRSPNEPPRAFPPGGVTDTDDSSADEPPRRLHGLHGRAQEGPPT
jgi:ribonuclease HI